MNKKPKEKISSDIPNHQETLKDN